MRNLISLVNIHGAHHLLVRSDSQSPLEPHWFKTTNQLSQRETHGTTIIHYKSYKEIPHEYITEGLLKLVKETTQSNPEFEDLKGAEVRYNIDLDVSNDPELVFSIPVPRAVLLSIGSFGNSSYGANVPYLTDPDDKHRTPQLMYVRVRPIKKTGVIAIKFCYWSPLTYSKEWVDFLRKVLAILNGGSYTSRQDFFRIQHENTHVYKLHRSDEMGDNTIIHTFQEHFESTIDNEECVTSVKNLIATAFLRHATRGVRFKDYDRVSQVILKNDFLQFLHEEYPDVMEQALTKAMDVIENMAKAYRVRVRVSAEDKSSS